MVGWLTQPGRNHSMNLHTNTSMNAVAVLMTIADLQFQNWVVHVIMIMYRSLLPSICQVPLPLLHITWKIPVLSAKFP